MTRAKDCRIAMRSTTDTPFCGRNIQVHSRLISSSKLLTFALHSSVNQLS
jgi:hypothetical protein